MDDLPSAGRQLNSLSRWVPFWVIIAHVAAWGVRTKVWTSCLQWTARKGKSLYDTSSILTWHLGALCSTEEKQTAVTGWTALVENIVMWPLANRQMWQLIMTFSVARQWSRQLLKYRDMQECQEAENSINVKFNQPLWKCDQDPGKAHEELIDPPLLVECRM